MPIVGTIATSVERNRPTAMRCELVTWQRFCELSRRLSQMIRASAFRPDMIVAIGRGGYMPARLLSDSLDVYNMTGFKIEHYHAANRKPQAILRYPLSAKVEGLKLLLVDDVSDAGDTFELAVSHLHESGPPAELKTAVLHHKTVSSFIPDYYAEEQTEWRWLIYPWSILEDVSGFIRELDLIDAGTEKTQAGIESAYGVRIPIDVLDDARILSRQYSENQA